MSEIKREDLVQITDYIYEVPQSFRADMRVPARIFMSDRMMDDVLQDRAIAQLVNVATLPGIKRHAYAMPDIHQGYGFPIGGVAATAINEGGVISPGGIGYDINCGVRLLVASITEHAIRPYLPELATKLFNAVPSGVGRGGSVKFDQHDLDKILVGGSRRMLELGFGLPEDVSLCEDEGVLDFADPSLVSVEAKKRGNDQIGTLGSGNHFLEVQAVEEIFDQEAAEAFGLSMNAVTVMIHCGSRGFGHQVCTDYVRIMMDNLPSWDFELPDRELVCAPFSSQPGQDYFSAMAAAANFAWANRHMIGHWVRGVFNEQFNHSVSLKMVYDVSHNIGKKERHEIDGKMIDLVLHRKGATRAFGPGRLEVCEKYRDIGQPVLIPGTMGTGSFVLAGTKESMDVAFGSSCHGAGRRMSRQQAKKQVRGSTLREELERAGIVIRSDSDVGLAEEAPLAYKDVDVVVDVVQQAGLAKKVARLKPLAVIKGG